MDNKMTGQPLPGLLNTDIIRLTLRAAIGRKRTLLFVLPAVILIGISALLKATTNSPLWPPEVLGTVGYLILALTALIVGGSVLGAEIDDGSILHLLATPVSRRTVILSKYLVAVGLTIAFAAVPEYLAGAIATGACERTGRRVVRRRAGGLGHLQRVVPDADGGVQSRPGARVRAAVRAALGGPAGQPGAGRRPAVSRALHRWRSRTRSRTIRRCMRT